MQVLADADSARKGADRSSVSEGLVVCGGACLLCVLTMKDI